MKFRNLIFALVMLLPFAVSAQSNYLPMNSRYRYIAGKFDSTLHIPTGATNSIRTGGYAGAGAIFFNTSDSSLYVYTGYQWRQLGGGGAYTPFDTVQVLGITKIIQRDTTSYFGIGTNNPKFHFMVRGLDTTYDSDPFPGSYFLYDRFKSAFRLGYYEDSSLVSDSLNYYTIGIGNKAYARGQNSVSISTSSNFETFGNVAAGQGSYSIGRNNQSLGTNAGTIGVGNYNSGSGVLIGSGNTTVDTLYGRAANISFALGEACTSIGDGSLATGFRTRSLGQGSFSSGYYTEADSTYSHAMGNKISVRGYGSFGIGLYNSTYTGENTEDTITRDSTMAIMGGHLGVGTVTPDSMLTVERGIWGKRGVNFSGLPNGGGSADSVLVVTSTGEIKKRNAADFGGSGGGSGWGLSGNSITAGVDKLGTTNNTSLRLITNGTQRAIFDSLGQLILGNRTNTIYSNVMQNIVVPNNSSASYSLFVDDASFSAIHYLANDGKAYHSGDGAFGGTLTTGNPGSGAGAWKLGTVHSGTGLYIDPTAYIEISIGGTTYWLALAAPPSPIPKPKPQP